MLRVIQHAALVLTPRSASAHIAAAYQIPAFLWLPHDGENWHLDYPHWITRRVSIDDHWEMIGASLRSFIRALKSRSPSCKENGRNENAGGIPGRRWTGFRPGRHRWEISLPPS
jgi:hypothetical protein